jgi:hypothetical protein
LISYLDHGVNSIQKRVDNRMTNRKIKPAPGEDDGYRAYWEVAKDLDGLVDVVWVSGSRMNYAYSSPKTSADMRYSKPPDPLSA